MYVKAKILPLDINFSTSLKAKYEILINIISMKSWKMQNFGCLMCVFVGRERGVLKRIGCRELRTCGKMWVNIVW